MFLSEEEWAERWVQTLVWIATQCLDPRPDAHNYAATNLHKALFSATVPTPPVAVLRRTFDDVLYRLLPEILISPASDEASTQTHSGHVGIFDTPDPAAGAPAVLSRPRRCTMGRECAQAH